MEMTHKYVIEAYMNALYDGRPEGALLESVKDFEIRLSDFAEENPRSADIMADSGMRDEYNQLYMAVINRNNDYSTAGTEEPKAFDYAKAQRVPTVHEFLDTYRLVYEKAVKPNKRELTDRAYQKLFDVENRTDDLLEAQMIIEREHLILNTVTADYKEIVEDFMEAADPNYEVTSATVKATIGVYATAKSLEEITYMGEVARATCDDIAIQVKLKVEMMTIFTSLIFAWERSKRKLREGGAEAPEHAKAMVLTRRQLRQYYRFLSEDMGLTFEEMEKTPFYRISMLNPQGLDELWRIKKVMHPDNIRAIKYVLFEEILTDRSMEDILLTPQAEPYYEMIDTRRYPEMDREFNALAEELNKDIRYFQRNRRPEGEMSQESLINKTKKLSMALAESGENSPAQAGMPGASGARSAAGSVISSIKGMDPSVKKEMGKSVAKGAAADVVKDIGKGLLRGLFRK